MSHHLAMEEPQGTERRARPTLTSESRSGQVSAAFQAAVDHELGDRGARGLRAPAAQLSARYRGRGAAGGAARFGPGEVLAYLGTRAPATFAATKRVLAELSSLRPDWAPSSVLDIGAGPGTAAWAAAAVFESIERAVLVERDHEMAALGTRLSSQSPARWLTEATWSNADAAQLAGRAADLVIASYVLGELGQRFEMPALEQWWRATVGEMVLVEPGTPSGFERLRAARETLVGWGARVTAPCPHDDRCPMEGSDWCHFAVRLTRSPVHQSAKQARLGYEDEKYSYLVVSRHPPAGPVARLVRSPRTHKGHVRLWLCEADGLNERVVSRRDGEVYKRARSARWGDRMDISSESS
jgi:ribosomal protein RSM22 (predicted rRNA methylase)